jgi:hypothetical protein
MNTRRRITAALLLVTSLVMLACNAGKIITSKLTAVPSALQSGVTGRIYRSDTDDPVLNVTVKLVDPAVDAKDPAYVLAETRVNAQGQYTFKVKPGEYGLTILEEETEEYALPCEPGSSITFDASGNLLYQTLSYTENGKFYLLEIIKNITVTAGQMTVKDFDMHCFNY